MTDVPEESRPVAFVTGASRGIGRAIAIELARIGYDIAGNATSYDPANHDSGLGEVEERVNETGASFLAAPGDISCIDDQQQMLNAVLGRFGRIDLLINNAGVAPLQRRDMLEMPPESFDRVIGVNARGTFFLTQLVARRMIEQANENPDAHPSIIFISSISANVSSPTRAEYCMSKAAISQAAHLFADRLAEFGINVYEVRPGIIRTDMTAVVEDKYDRLIDEGLIPQNRWGQPEDVARAVVALARGDFPYSTGMIIEVSGGMNIRRL
ncbi:MAG: 3-ketoacyl-ACP reductase [Phycisphaerales bacterium]|nr:MAG: 3-ketoacyl-ACP reductase [Phycisphaerales bacterium]